MQETIVIVQARNNHDRDQSVSSKCGKRWDTIKYIFEAQPIGLTNGLGVTEEKRSEDNSKALALSLWVDADYQMNHTAKIKRL